MLAAFGCTPMFDVTLLPVPGDDAIEAKGPCPCRDCDGPTEVVEYDRYGVVQRCVDEECGHEQYIEFADLDPRL